MFQEMQVSDNPTLRKDTSDPTIICTAYKKNRFYMFSRRNPDETQQKSVKVYITVCTLCECVMLVCLVEEMVTEMCSMKNHPRKKSWRLLKE